MEDLQNFVALSLPGGVHEDHDLAYVTGWRITTCLCSTHLEHSSHGGAEEGQLKHQYGITINQDGFLYDCDSVNYKTYFLTEYCSLVLIVCHGAYIKASMVTVVIM